MVSRVSAGARLHPYLSAVLAVAVAALARMLLQPILGYGLPFITFFAAVFLIAWWLGLRPALLAVGLSAIAAGLLFFPAGRLPQERLLTAVGLALFMAIGAGAAAMGEGRLRAQRRAQREADEARLARIAAEDAAVEAEMAAEQAAESAALAAEQARRLAAIVDSSDDAIISKDVDGTVRSWNPAAQRIFGYTAAEMVGQSVFRLVPPELQADEHDVLAQIRRGEHVAHYEADRLRKDGQRIRIALTISPIHGASGAVIGASAIKRDITEQRNIEAQLRQAQQLDAIGQLAGGVAHDFNNVLAAIAGYVTLALRALPSGDPVRTDLLGIQEAVDRAAALTQQLLAFGRKQMMQPVLVDLREVLDDTGRMLKRLIGEHIDLAVAAGPMLSPVLADRGQLGQVILNLALNARDAMPTGGRLTIEARDAPLTEEYTDTHLAVTPGPYVLLAVSDTGHGMTSEIKAHIFEPFFTTKPQGKGTGLGLSTVFGIIKQFGGHIFVYSEPDQGTTFKIYIPRAEGAIVAAAPAQVSGPGPGGTETLLFVEDDPAIRTVIRRFLEMSAYTVLEAASPREALELAGSYERRIDLLLTDVVLPKMSGRELAERLAAQRPGLLVLYMSGYTGDAIVHQGRLEPDTAFLQKPFAPDALLRQIREVLGPGDAGAPTAAGA
jgi:two-component system cell cycle sensor histidine kinase/response regulator CckA